MSGSIDDLQVRDAPNGQQCRPRCIAIISSDLEQGNAVIDLGILDQPFALRDSGASEEPSGAGHGRSAQSISSKPRRNNCAMQRYDLGGRPPQRSRCQPNRKKGCPHTQQWPGPFSASPAQSVCHRTPRVAARAPAGTAAADIGRVIKFANPNRRGAVIPQIPHCHAPACHQRRRGGEVAGGALLAPSG